MSNSTRKWFVIAMLAGCGGTTANAPAANTANEAKPEAAVMSTRPVSKRGSDSVSATVGSGGGSLELNEGPRVSIPAGAVSDPMDFVLKIAPKTTAFHNKEGERPLGPTFSFSPPLDAPGGIEVSFPLASLPEGWGEPSIAYEVAMGDIVGAEDSTRTKWHYERAAMSGGRVVAQLPSLTGLRLQFVLTNLEVQ